MPRTKSKNRVVDPREQPAYSVPEAAHYLALPKATLRAWVFGQRQGGTAAFKPIIKPPDRSDPALSFMNLVEAHVLSALRRQHRISLQAVRRAVLYLGRKFPSPHPLADNQFATDGVELFVEKWGELLRVDEPGQMAMREILRVHLDRIDRDPRGIPAKLFPFTRRSDLDDPRAIVIDPRVAFGRPVLIGTGIPTAVVAERFSAGESIDDLAEDYDRRRAEIEEAIRCERPRTAA